MGDLLDCDNYQRRFCLGASLGNEAAMTTQPSQKDRILRRLNLGQLCSMEPLDWEPRIYRVAARVKDLRDDGHQIVSDLCGEHGCTENHAVYRLVEQDQGALF